MSAPGGEPNVIFRGMFESAITDMLKGYTDKEIHQRLLSIPTSGGEQKTGITM